ncbi:unnamed protein product [Brachionus calyciflorus]|uniref:GPAT/DHAPAT C-terminal domain-containing protein n=1 Tax=Brachionus calyciflorus TaxID=104777 RepID=A0A813MVI9_9BILA|nr:unnamed protein product [Brachionus calyciflorus]
MELNAEISNTTGDGLFFLKKLNHVYNGRVKMREPIPFKSTPFIFPENIYSQSALFKKCCIDCSANSNVYYEPKNKQHHFVDLFQAPAKYLSNKKNSLKRLNKRFFYSFDCELVINMKTNDYDKRILSNTNIIKLLNEREQSNKLQENKLFKDNLDTKLINQKILKLIQQFESKSKFRTKKMIKMTLIAVNNLFRNFFNKIICYQIHLSALKAAQDKQLPIVYVMDPESTLIDRLIFQLTLFLNNFRITNIFVSYFDKNWLFYSDLIRCVLKIMNIDLIDEQALLKNQITTNKQQVSSNDSENIIDSKIYKQILSTYVMELLKNEVDIVLQSNSLILDFLVEFIEKELVHDVLVVPVSVCYEKLNKSSIMETKFQNFSQAFLTLTKKILLNLFTNRKHGHVRVNFGQAFSMKEFIENNKSKAYLKYIANNHKLKKHLKYDIFQSETIMCVNILAFILITYFPKGCNANQLCHKFLEIKNLLSFNYQIGFNYNSIQDVITYGLNLLNDHIIIEKTLGCEEKMKNIFVRPKTDLKSFHELFKYSKIISKIFFLNSVIANSINQIVKFDLYYINFECNNSNLSIDENELIEKCFQLVSIFQYEFDMFKKPCETIFSRIYTSLNELVNSEILIDLYAKQFDGNLYRINNAYKKQYDNDDGTDSEDENEYFRKSDQKNNIEKKNNNEYNADIEEISQWKPSKKPKIFNVNRDKNLKLMLFYKVLQPFIEAYLRFLKTIQNLEHGQLYSKKKIIQLVDEETKKQAEKGLIKYLESTDASMIESAFNFAILVGIFDKIWYSEVESNKLNENFGENELFIHSFNNESKAKIYKYYTILKSF